jgi:3-hydroxybutyryl-CoA dehydratase
MTSHPKGYCYEDFTVGEVASRTNLVTEDVINAFAEVSTDKNPVHIDAEYAKGTMFKERIAHGMLSAGYISSVIGMQMPGPGCIYVSQTLNFKAPVKIGDTVSTSVTVLELLPKRRVRFATVCAVDGKTVVEGEAVMLVPGRPA